jgi:pimeloyl-ACP methyl ester carboxylesterase
MTPRFAVALVFGLLLVPGAGRAEESSFDSNGVKIQYVVEGKGEPVLLIHGFVVNKEIQWGAPGIIKALAKNHRVIALDNRGHGKSGKPTDPKKYGTEMVEDAVRLLDHLKIKKAHVVGYSMGAIITAKLMVTHPDRLLSATLAGAGAIREGMELPPFVGELADSLDKGKGIGPLLLVLAPPGTPKPSKDMIERLNQLLVGNNGKALAAVVRSWKNLAVTDAQLKANRVPALALIGEMDPLKKAVDDLKDRMANLQVVVIGGTDHMTAFVSPKFVKSLEKFLDKHAQPSRDRQGAGKASTP